jgi:hypothetical protein
MTLWKGDVRKHSHSGHDWAVRFDELEVKRQEVDGYKYATAAAGCFDKKHEHRGRSEEMHRKYAARGGGAQCEVLLG